jgi:hypothetical protein
MSNIFYNIEPKIINTELACLIGLNDAIVLQQLHYWIEKNKATGTNCFDGRVWTYGTIQEYRDRDFPFWSIDTVKRTLGSLVKRGFLIRGNYNRMKMDHTNWYSIDYSAIDEWIRRSTPTSDSSPINMTHINQDNIRPFNGVSYPHQPEQHTPNEQGRMPSSNGADCPHRAVQTAPIEQGRMPPSKGADCPNPSAQTAPMEQGRLPRAIQETKKEINNKRLENKTNRDAWASSSQSERPATQKAPPPSAGGSVFNPTAGHSASNAEPTAAFDIEILEPAELLFDEFWKLYPRKESKKQAKKAWLKLNPGQELFNLIANALEYRSQTKEWLAEGGRYIPHPATWLNGRRWEDEINPAKIDQSAVLEERYSGITLDGKPLDPVQRKQLEYIKKQMREQAYTGEV